MVDFAYVCGMASDEAPGETGHEYDHEVHSPEGFCGTGFFDVRQGSERRLNTNRKNSQTCKYCGAKELFWFQPNIGRYRLKNKDGSEHVCQEYLVKNTPLIVSTARREGMSNHTPGPWAVHPLEPMSVHQPEYQCWIPQNEADACLIAAAPDLLAALEDMVICFERFEDTHTALVMEAARIALGKAVGKKK